MAALQWAMWRDRWPNAGASRFVDAGGVRWHVQVSGTGPVVLLLHGSGGATHSWRDVLPLLAAHCTVVAPDLPGHAFTSRPASDDGLSLPAMAAGVALLMRELGVVPQVVVGHSAGAAVALKMALDGAVARDGVIVGLNAALAPPALPANLAMPIAGALAALPGVARLVSTVARLAGTGEALVDSTGTPLDEAQRGRYAALVEAPAHVDAVLTMMARWDLAPLVASLPGVAPSVTLAAAPDDPWVPPDSVARAAARIPRVRRVELAAPGHLAHERDASATVRLILDAAREAGIV